MKLGERGAESSTEVTPRVWQAEVTAIAYSHVRLHLNRLKFTYFLYQRDTQDPMLVINTWYVSDILPHIGNMAKLLMAATVKLSSIFSSFHHQSSIPLMQSQNPISSR